MRLKSLLVVATAVLAVSCARVRPIELAPPTAIPSGLAWGYGVEKISGDAGGARRDAYLRAVDDLLSRGPLVVSKVVSDRTTVVNQASPNRRMESVFRLRASAILQPRFVRNGFEDGFAWVLVGMTPGEIERGWQDFLLWRDARIAEATRLFDESDGAADPVLFLEASLQILEEAGAREDPGLVYYRVRAALDAELERRATLDALRREIAGLIAGGKLVAADAVLERGLVTGLTAADYEAFKYRIEDRRARASALVRAGDALYGEGQYRQSLERYEEAGALDVNHPGLAARTAKAESAHRVARSRTIGRTLNVIGGAVGEYFEWRREEARREDRRERREERDGDRGGEDSDSSAGSEVRLEPAPRPKSRSGSEPAPSPKPEQVSEPEEEPAPPPPLEPVETRIPADGERESPAKPPRGPGGSR